MFRNFNPTARKPASGTDEDKTDFHIAAEEGILDFGMEKMI